MTWSLQKWGAVCKDVGDFVTDLVEGFPQFSVGIGPDEDDLREAPPRITFVTVDAGTFDEPRYSGSDETFPTFDEEIPVTVTIWAALDIDTTTKEDKSPLLLEAVVSRFLEGCDAAKHVPYMIPRTQRRRGGRKGEDGSKAIISCVIRVGYDRTPYTMAEATSTTIGLGVEGPDGNGGTTVDQFEVIGEAPP
jgi:hypothetical protein